MAFLGQLSQRETINILTILSRKLKNAHYFQLQKIESVGFKWSQDMLVSTLTNCKELKILKIEKGRLSGLQANWRASGPDMMGEKLEHLEIACLNELELSNLWKVLPNVKYLKVLPLMSDITGEHILGLPKITLEKVF